MNILIPGGCGYIGSMLVPQLLSDGHRVTVYDVQWFGRGHLPGDNDQLTVIKGDVRYLDLFKTACEGKDAIIYLAGLSNNEMCEKKPLLHDAVNRDAFPPVVAIAKAAGVKRFIFASSVAAYGSSENCVQETQPLAPSTLYGWAKEFCENWLLAHQSDDFKVAIVRSASVCGYSLHQRFDLTVNMMVHDAVRCGVITIHGGEQKRSHIHIRDVCDFYILLLGVPEEKIAGQIFNVVAENQTVNETSELIADFTGCKREWKSRSDNRSYTVDGRKARESLGFSPVKTILDAVRDLKMRFDAGYWPDSLTNPVYQNMADGLF